MSAPTPPAGFLDAASGQPLNPAAREAWAAAADAGWADPGRLYREGRRAALLRDSARESVAARIGARPDEVSLVADGDLVIAERIDRIRVGERWIELPCCGVFHLRDGRIPLWKDYFDLQTYPRALAG